MSQLAFSDTKFDSSSYSAFRPTYGSALFDQLMAFHAGRSSVALDLGCGTGQITTVLADRFEKVYGFDTSAKMLETAIKRDNITYRVGQAESLPLDEASVDLVTVGQAAHWFDSEAWFQEMSRILRKDGTLSFWSYNEAEFTDSVEASKIWNEYSHASDKLGPHWPQPGRSILESAMKGFDPPKHLFRDIQRHYTAQHGSTAPSPVSKTMPLDAAESYFRTASSFHNWQTANPDKIAKRNGGEGDIIDAMMQEIKDATGWTHTSTVNVHWPTVAVLARK